MNRTTALLFLLLSILLTAAPHPAKAWQPKTGPLDTPYASQVSQTLPWPEYPRPQLTRADWLNLNGIWQYQSGAAADPLPTGQTLSSEIRVPFPVESALSGVMEHHDRLWYRRFFTVPAAWKSRRTLLHFDAVDYEAEIFVNGKSVGVHTGGYEAFAYDVTDYLKGSGPQELIVRVFDPTDLGGQPRGKQSLHPGGIMYTPTSGIWQTVWLEPVSRLAAVADVKIVPDVDKSRVTLTVSTLAPAPSAGVTIKIIEAGRVVKTVTTKPNVPTTVALAKPRLWSPSSPFLYDLDVTLTQNKTVTDHVGSYFGMRKISLGKVGGITKMLVNNKFVFEIGPLDQGFWPDGIYTPPTDTAMKGDLQAMKTFGFNMVRKHIKVESQRWYYWADKLGLLVWQDMPSPDSYTDHAPPVDRAAFEKQERQVIESHWNHPCIIMWVIFNESQGRHDTRNLVALAKTIDPSRLTDRDSGAGYEKGGNGVAGDGDIGDVDDVHSYPPPACPPPSPNQALVCGEYGGIGLVVPNHTWKLGTTYTEVDSPMGLQDLYGEFTNKLKGFRDDQGLSAAVYTQITDVETELNGLMTYDRRFKCDPAQIARANRFQYPSPTYHEIVPTSEKAAQTWKYTLTNPIAGWTKPSFDDSAWQTGPGGFGTSAPVGAPVGTPWNTPDIWLRRTFNPGPLSAEQISRLVVRDQHDEDIEVYINDILAYRAGGFISDYEYKPVSADAQKSLKPGAENTLAVHCRQTIGGQFIDVGLSERIPGQP